MPFTGETFLGVLAKHVNDPPPPMTAVTQELWISPQLQAVIMKALVKKPEDRYASMQEFAQALSSTPEGALSYRPPPMPGGEQHPSFIPPAPSNPTAPEFGVVTGAPATPLPSPERDQATLARGSGEPPDRIETPLASERNRSSLPADSQGSRLPLIFGACAAVLLLVVGAAFAFRSKPSAPQAATSETNQAANAAPTPSVAEPTVSPLPLDSAPVINSIKL